MKKINLNSSTKTVVMITFLSVLAKIFGFMRESVIAYFYGAGSDTDVFFLALTTISMITTLITETINTTLIPILSTVEKESGKEGKHIYLNNFINIITIITFSITILAYVFMPKILLVVASGFDEQKFKLLIKLSRLGLPTIYLSTLVGVLRGFLQSEGHFLESAYARIIKNATFIIGLILTSKYIDVRILMMIQVLSVGSPLILQIQKVKKSSYIYGFALNFKDKHILDMLYMLPPIWIGVAVDDLNKVIDNSLASTLAEGSISALNYAAKLDSITIGIFVLSIITVMFPKLSAEAANRNMIKFKAILIDLMNVLILLTIPASVGMIVLRYPIIKLAFQRGEFDFIATQMTAGALTFYSVGLLGSSLKILLTRAFFSIKDTKTPMINSVFAVLINLVFNVILLKYMAHEGLALATSIATTFSSLLLIILMYQKIDGFDIKEVVTTTIKSLFASLVMGIVLTYLLNRFVDISTTTNIKLLLILIILVILGVFTYLFVLIILKVKVLRKIFVKNG